MKMNFEQVSSSQKDSILGKKKKQVSSSSEDNNVIPMKILEKLGKEVSLSANGQHSSLFVGVYKVKIKSTILHIFSLISKDIKLVLVVSKIHKLLL